MAGQGSASVDFVWGLGPAGHALLLPLLGAWGGAERARRGRSQPPAACYLHSARLSHVLRVCVHTHCMRSPCIVCVHRVVCIACVCVRHDVCAYCVRVRMRKRTGKPDRPVGSA